MLAGESDPLKIKLMEKWKKDLLEEQNKARIALNFPPMTIRVRQCLFCKKPFESVSRRTCGCKEAQVTSLSGLDVC